jgi:photosystem II stability/assembly factor-like uncharacterized protein
MALRGSSRKRPDGRQLDLWVVGATALIIVLVVVTFILRSPAHPSPTQQIGLASPTPMASPTPSASPTPAPSPTPQPTPVQIAARIQSQPSVSNITTLAFGDAVHGWAGGDGAILATTDGGSHWTTSWQGGLTVTEIRALGPARAWALAYPPTGGARGGILSPTTLLTTADGGHHWASLPLGQSLYGLQLTSATTGWALGWDDAALWHTSDGGRSWRRVQAGPFAAACFASSAEGWAIGSSVLQTRDGGLHWRAVARSPLSVNKGASLTCRGGVLWLLGPVGGAFANDLVRSTNGGRTWSVVLGNGANPGGSGSFDAPDGATAFVMGTSIDGSAVAVMVTHDGGRTWTNATVDDAGGGPSAVVAVDDQVVWFVGGVAPSVGPDSYLVASTDGGRTWHERWPTATPRPVSALSFVSPTTGFGTGIVGDGEAVVRTDDGGVTWRLVGQLPKPALPASAEGGAQTLSSVDTETGWALTAGGLYATRDGGATWTAVALPAGIAPPVAVAFRDPLDGCVLATDATDFFHALATSDGGRTWADVPGGQAAVQGCAWGDAGAGLVASADSNLGPKAPGPGGLVVVEGTDAWVPSQGAILRTANSGASWQAITWSQATGPQLAGAIALTFGSPEDGWLLTGDGHLLRTTDGGLTWSELP